MLIMGIGFSSPVSAAPSKILNYQGQLKNNLNVPITTPTTIQFSIYGNPSTGTPGDTPSASGPLLWTETYDGLVCAKVTPNSLGIISVRLGSCVALPSYLKFAQNYYLGLKIDTNLEATPRLQLTSTPYSENVRNISFDENSASAFNIGTSIADYLSFNSTTGSESITLSQNTTIGTSAQQLTIGAILQGAAPLVFEGATNDIYKTTLAVTDPTGNRIITLPDASGTVALLSDLPSAITASNGISRVLNNMQLGGVLTQDTLIDGNGGAFDLTFQDLKSFDIGGGGVGALGSISNTNVNIIATNLLQLLSPMTYVQSGTPDVSGLRLVNLNSASPTNAGQAIGVDALGNIITVASAGSLTTANNGLTVNPAGNVQLGGALIQNTNINLGVNTLTFDQTDVNSSFKIQGASAYSPGFASQDVFQLETFANEGFAITSYQDGPLITDEHGMFLNFTSNLATPLGDPLGAYIYSERTTGEIGIGRFGGGQISISDNGISLNSNGQNDFQAETSQTFFANNSSLLLPGEAGYNFTTTNAYNSDLAVANFSSGTGSGIDLFVGSFNPNGQFTGDPGSIYFNTTPSDNNDILWLKSPFGGFNTNTDWIPVITSGFGGNEWYAENAVAPLIAPVATGLSSIAIGDGASATGRNVFAFGDEAGSGSISRYSNFFGWKAGKNSGNAGSSENNFFGIAAGEGATNVSGGNFFGSLSGGNATDASFSNFFGESAGESATNANNSNFFGRNSGQRASGANNSNFYGTFAGQDATGAFFSNFFGLNAGNAALSANNSNFYGTNAGINAANANNSNFIGTAAGQDAFNAFNSNFIGNLAGFSAINAYNSNFFGVGAGQGAINAYDSSFYGTNAGNSATDANNSNFIGSNAGLNATNASRSNFFGMGAGDGAAGAFSSNFFGPNAGQNATDANTSNFFGELAGNGAANANNSNFFGYQSGERALNAANSIFIGNGAGNNDSVDNFNVPGTSILIGDRTSTGGNSNSIAIGFNASNDRTNQFLVGPNYSDFSFRNVNYTFPSAQATGVGEVLTNDGTGILSWAAAGTGSVTASNGLNAVGIDVRLGGALTQPTTITATGGDNLTINGSNYTTNTGVLSVSRNAGSAAAGAAIQGNSIVNAGVPLMQNVGGRFDAVSGDTGVATVNYGTLNTASVSGTAPGIVNVGSRNVAILNLSGGNLASLRGSENLANLGAGSVGSAIGSLNDILLQNGTNITNAFGVTTSLTKGATASVSRFSGFYMEDNNTGIANRSGLFLGTSSNAGYTGEWGIYSALNRNNAINGSLSVGSLNVPTTRLQVTTGVANDSGLRLTNLTSASPSVPGQAIGVDANGKVVTVGGSTLDAVYRSNPGTSNIVNIDAATGAPTFRISNTDNTGILFENSVTPSRSMYIGQDNVFTTSNVIEGNGMNMRIGTGSNHDLLFRTNGSERMRVLSGGNVAIGTNSAPNKLTVEDLATTSVARFNGSGSTQCTIVTGTGITCSSDGSLKKNIASIKGLTALDAINKLNPVTYNWKEGSNTLQFGFLAQEVEEVLPGLVTFDTNGYKSLNTIGMIPFIAKAIQEQQAQIDLIKQQISSLGGSKEFAQVLKTSKPIQVSKDTANVATIKAGNTNVEVNFSQKYSNTPVITATPSGEATLDQDFKFVITNISSSGFTISIRPKLENDIEFNWIALDQAN